MKIRTKNFEIFFGDRASTLESIRLKNPRFDFCSLHQVHGDQIVEANPSREDDADAHFTKTPKQALLIKTADCMPIFAFDSVTGTAIAIHAGWRGIANNITIRAIKKLKLKPAGLRVYVGPHIQKESFVVRQDCLTALIKGTGLAKLQMEKFVTEISEDQYQISLAEILTHQLLELGILAENISINKIDTHTNAHFHSFRRDKSDTGRNWSFISIADQ